MKPVRLTLIATACALAITACSSGNSPRSLPEQKPTTTTAQSDAVKKAEAALQDEKAKLAAKETALKNQEKALAEKQQEIATLKQQAAALEAKQQTLTTENSQLATEKSNAEAKQQELDAQQKALNAKIQQLEAEKTQLEADKKQLAAEVAQNKPIVEAYNKAKQAEEAAKKVAEEKARQEAEAARKAEEAAKQAAEEAKKAEEAAKKAAEEAKKSEDARISFNQGEVKKGFTNNGTDASGISYVSGGALVVNGNSLAYQPVEAQSKKIDQLIVEGKTIELFSLATMEKRQEAYENETHNFDSITEEGLTGKVGSLPKRRAGDDFAQMRFGYATAADGKTTLFVQGIQTPVNGDIKSPFNYFYATRPDETETLRPLEDKGRFEYLGYAFYGKDSQYKEYSVKGLADMDNKKVKVDIAEDDKVKLTLGGVIDGSQFAGNHQGAEMKGAFYGTKGQDIGGLFYQTQGDEKDFTGVFGATKRDCGWRGCDEPAETLADFDVK